MNSINITLTEDQVKFLINLMWANDTSTLAKQHYVSDGALEDQLVKCLGYAALGHV